jgi:TonB family protein
MRNIKNPPSLRQALLPPDHPDSTGSNGPEPNAMITVDACGGMTWSLPVTYLAAPLIAAAGLLTGASAAPAAPAAPTPSVQAAPSQPDIQSAGLCVRLNDQGEVIDAQIAQTSGDETLDENAVALARTLQWAPPYPKAGWLGVRITLSNTGPGPTPAEALPHCSAASDAKSRLAI